jgi:NTP pyrophosphatase (non-canonical NTP hydrolase)
MAGNYDMNGLRDEVGKWASENFEVHNPLLGLIEEVGELAHCFLKRSQKIRGFENPKVFEELAKDAIGDIGIYAAHFASIHNLNLDLDIIQSTCLKDYTSDRQRKTGINHFFLTILSNLTRLNPPMQYAFDLFLWSVANLALSEGFDMVSITIETWDSVKQRDWKANHHTGITVPDVKPQSVNYINYLL